MITGLAVVRCDRKRRSGPSLDMTPAEYWHLARNGSVVGCAACLFARRGREGAAEYIEKGQAKRHQESIFRFPQNSQSRFTFWSLEEAEKIMHKQVCRNWEKLSRQTRHRVKSALWTGSVSLG